MAERKPSPRHANSRDRRRPRQAPDGPVRLYGLHTVAAALANPRRTVHRLLVTENALGRLALPPDRPIAIETVRPKALDALVGADAVHQGVVLETEPLPRAELEDIADDARLLLFLDQVTDPHNVGAILRTAAAYAADAVVTTARHAPGETAVLGKAASGALDLVSLVEVGNLATAIEMVKAQGFLIVGLDGDAPDDLAAARLAAPLALVLGAEGKGLRQRTAALCDQRVRIALPGPVASLNVSNAAAVALHVARTAIG
jgi:23S rRNA (guanosine2251-2'-O)-methyltransferase